MDTDCILLGPGGLFVFEVKHYNGYTVCMDGRWRRRKVGRRGTVYRGRIGSPSGQLTRNVVSLKEWIERASKAPWIEGYVVFTNGWLHSEGMRHLKAIEISRLAEVIPQGRNMLDDDALPRSPTPSGFIASVPSDLQGKSPGVTSCTGCRD